MGRGERVLLGIGGFLLAVFLGGQIGIRLMKKPEQEAPVVPSALAAPMLTAPKVVCPPDSIPVGARCFPLLVDGDEGVSLLALPQTREVNGATLQYEQIPRAEGRPEDYELYVYPAPPGLPGGRSVGAGYDLDLPEAQRRKVSRTLVGHGGVDVPGMRGTPITLVPIEHQSGDAEILFAGTFWGNTVITRHTRKEGGFVRDYVMIFAHLDKPAPAAVAGARVRGGEVLGGLGDSGATPGATHLHLEVRRAREGVDLGEVAKVPNPAYALLGETIVCDPRNVLPLRARR